MKGAEAGQLWRTGNETIDRAREIAIDLLQPTPAQVQRAWELHAASLVFDAYGFAPRAAVDGARFQAGGARPAPRTTSCVDLREEMGMTRWATDAAEREEFLEAFRAAGVTCIFQNAGEEGNDPLRLLKRLARFTYATDLLRRRRPRP